jgi:hypothetical protein
VLNNNPLLTFQDNVSVPSSRAKKSKKSREEDFFTLEDGIDTLSQNVSRGLPFDTA